MRTLALLGLLVFGLPAQGQTPLLIQVHAPGLASGTVEQSVLTPLEQQLRGLEPVRRLRGLALEGRCLLRLQPSKDTDPEVFRLQVQNRLALVQRKWPPHCTTEIRPAAEGAFMLITSEPDGDRPVSDRKLADTSALVNNMVRPVLADVPGIAHIEVAGATEETVRVVLDPHKLKAWKLSEDDAIAAIQDSLKETRDWTIRGKTVIVKKMALEDLGNIPLKLASNVYLRDVARPALAEEARQECRITLRKDRELRSRRAVFVLAHPAPGKLHPLAVKGLEKALHSLRLATNPLDGILCEGHMLPVETTTVVLRFGGTEDMAQRTAKAQDVVKAMFELPQVKKVFSLVRPDDEEAVFWVIADPDRRAEFHKGLRAKLARIKGAGSRVGELYSPLFPWPGDGAQVRVRVQGKNFGLLLQTGERLCERLRKTAGIVDVDTFPRMREGVTIEVDREKAGLSGTTMRDVNKALTVHADRIELPLSRDPWRLTVEVPRSHGKKAMRFDEEIQQLPLGSIIPEVNLMIRDVAQVRLTQVPGGIVPHEDGIRCVLITANVEGRTREEARSDIRRIIQELTREGVRLDVE